MMPITWAWMPRCGPAAPCFADNGIDPGGNAEKVALLSHAINRAQAALKSAA
jgi:hypothetical protein